MEKGHSSNNTASISIYFSLVLDTTEGYASHSLNSRECVGWGVGGSGTKGAKTDKLRMAQEQRE